MKNPYRGRKPHALIKFCAKPLVLSDKNFKLRVRLIRSIRENEKKYYPTILTFIKMQAYFRDLNIEIYRFLGF